MVIVEIGLGHTPSHKFQKGVSSVIKMALEMDIGYPANL